MSTKYISKALESMDYFPNTITSTYYNREGQRVPRVTEILSRTIHSDGLMYWANSLGFRGIRYREALNNAADMGTEAHAAIEKYLKEKLETTDNIPFLAFMEWYNIITKDYKLSFEVIYSEHSLVCDWFGGTLDLLVRIDGRLFLVDFKTSNHVTFNYFLQMAAYRYMLKIVERINIDGIIVLQLNKLEPEFNEYMLDFRNLAHIDFINRCEETFLSLVYAYYNITRVEERFKTVFK